MVAGTEPRPYPYQSGWDSLRTYLQLTPKPDYGDCARMDALQAVRAEQQRQLHKWGVRHHSPEQWALILTEEIGEVAKAILENEEDAIAYGSSVRRELIQCAAVALTALQDFNELVTERSE